jgi:hypothetical protein
MPDFVMCQNCYDTFNETQLSALNATWRKWRDHVGRIQFWGQMSTNPKDPSDPPKQGEKCDCCLRKIPMHDRYLKSGFVEWVKNEVAEGYDVGYYSQTKHFMVDAAAGIDQTAWMIDWTETLRNNYSASAF